MTDDVTVDNGTLTDYVVSADAATADGALVQRVKLAYSADGSTTHVAADADGLLVNLGANNDVTVTGTVTASDGGGSLTVDDGGSSLTVDGSVSITGSVAVTDNSGSLTVDNAGTFAVQAAQSGTWTVQPGNTANTVAWKVDGSAVTQPVSIAAAVPVTDNSGSLTVDDGASSLTVDAPVGTPVFVRLSDGSSAITTLPVSLASVPSHAVTNVGTFAVQDSEKIADNAGFTDGTTKVLPTGYVYDEVAGTSLTENDIAAARIDAKRAQVLVLEDGTTRGQKAAVSAAGRLSVDGSGVTQPVSGTVTANLAAGTNAIGKLAANSGVTIGAVEIAAAQTLATDVTSVVPGTSATSLGKAVDSAAGATDTGVAILATRDDALSSITPAEGDWAQLRVDANGALWVQLAGTLSPTNDGVYIGASASGGATSVRNLDIDESEDDVKTSAGKLYGFTITNLHTATVYVKFFNATAANVTYGTTNPLLVYAIPAGGGLSKHVATGIDFSTAISVGASLGVADNDTTAIPSANLVVGTIDYK